MYVLARLVLVACHLWLGRKVVLITFVMEIIKHRTMCVYVCVFQLR